MKKMILIVSIFLSCHFAFAAGPIVPLKYVCPAGATATAYGAPLVGTVSCTTSVTPTQKPKCDLNFYFEKASGMCVGVTTITFKNATLTCPANTKQVSWTDAGGGGPYFKCQ